mmetsp:Transcript_33039/g.69073  ORF Transcript_33039/g.69073 Transcript_33039/m.69073 type:complete len:725 (-) Transcript_33039:448-2622(-)
MGGTASAPQAADTSAQEDALKKKGGSPLPVEDFVLKESRGCTDIMFLLFYIAFWGLMIYIGIVAFMNGDPSRLISGYDFNGNICGQGSKANYPYLYYPNPWPNASTGNPDLTWAVCVKSCPYETRKPPDMCTVSFSVQTEQTFLSSPKNITCGGGSEGRTDMSQFSPADLLLYTGFAKYCMQRLPVCICSPSQNATNGPQCCDGSNRQQYLNGVPQTVPNAAPAATILGFKVGYQYGFCFYTYPSMTVSSLTRCLPVPVGTKTAGSANATVGASFLSSLPADTGAANQTALLTFDSGLQSVLDAASNPQAAFSSLVHEVNVNKWVIVGSAGIALLVSLAYTQLLRFTARITTYTLLVALWLLLAAASVIMAVKSGLIQPSQVPAVIGSTAESITLPSGLTNGSAQTNQNLLSIATGVVGLTFVLYTVFLCVMISRISMALEVIEQAANCVRCMPLALVFPVLQWVALCGLFVWWVFVFVYLASSGSWDPVTRTFSWNDTIRRAIIYHFFGLLWGRAMILAVGNLIIAGATVQWFLSPDQKILSSPMLSSTIRSCRYHLGTAAFGSFLIAVVQFIRWVFRYYVYQVNKMNKDNRIVKILTCIGECCLSCLERFLNFVNKNAYIQTSIEGTNFCTSAVAAFNLLLRNFLRLGALTIVSSIFLQFGKVFIAVCTGFIAALIIVGGSMNNISEAPVFSITIVMLLAFAVGSAFMDVWVRIILLARIAP